MRRLDICAVGLWRIGFLALLCCWHISSLAQFDSKEWPQVTLRFTEGGTLKDVFDAGLRPYRFPTLERSLLEVKHARVTILQRDGQSLLEFPAELVQIHPLQGGLLSSVEMTRYKTTLDESRALILPYLPKGGRNVQELEHFLAAVKADYLNYNGMGTGLDNFAVRWNEEGGPRYVVAFRKAFDPVSPLILFLSIDWSQVRTPREMRSFYKEPIPPPSGFEDVSMQAPPKFGPDSQADILVSQGKAIAGDRPPPLPNTLPSSTRIPSAGSLPTMPATPSSAPFALHTVPVWPWFVGIATLLAIVGYFWKYRC